MFNKYQRDQQIKRVQELNKQRMVSGYLNDDKFDPSPTVTRMLASPARARAAEAGEGEGGQDEKPPQTDINASPGLNAEALRIIKARNKRNTDLANRSRQRMQGWLSQVGPPDELINCK